MGQQRKLRRIPGGRHDHFQAAAREMAPGLSCSPWCRVKTADKRPGARSKQDRRLARFRRRAGPVHPEPGGARKSLNDGGSLTRKTRDIDHGRAPFFGIRQPQENCKAAHGLRRIGCTCPFRVEVAGVTVDPPRVVAAKRIHVDGRRRFVWCEPAAAVEERAAIRPGSSPMGARPASRPALRAGAKGD